MTDNTTLGKFLNGPVVLSAEDMMELLIVASGAKTEEERARVAWRASDYMWRLFPAIAGVRSFNNLCQNKNWPWVEDLWSKEEIKAFRTVKEEVQQ